MSVPRSRGALEPTLILAAALAAAGSVLVLQACSRTHSPAPAPADAAGAAAAGCDGRAVERNKGVARVVFDEILSKGRIAENEHIYDPEFVVHGLTRDADRAEDRAASEGWRQAAPDLNMQVLHIVAECDLVAVNWEGTGTNTGAGNGLPATGKSIRVRGMTFFRLRDGRIFEEWTAFDQYSLLRQLGLLEKQATAPAPDMPR